MKANWVVMALAVLLLIICLAGGPRQRCYDCPSQPTFDPFRPARVLIMRPLYEAAEALAASQGW